MARFKIAVFGLWVVFGLAGCGDFFSKKPTELESKAVIRDIARVQENPYVGNPLPEVYREGPKRLKVDDGVKLFYFTKYQPIGDLTFKDDKNPALVKQVHGYGGTIRDLGFKVSTNPTTNQLVVHCATDEECDQVLAYLEKTDVPPIQVHIDCLILERFGDVTKDWETTLLIENFLGEGITLGEDKYPNPAFPGASLRESKRSTFGLDFGYWMNEGVEGHQVRLLVDVLESRGYLKILLNPTLDTINGKSAQVQIRDNAPIQLTVTEAGRDPYFVTDYQWVADTLSVTPYVYADSSIGLNTNITFGSKSKPEGVVQTPIITERSIRVAENRIQPGKSLIIGGMRKSENRSVVRGVPFFKDIPILGILFSSKDFEENATEVIFILTPTISSGGAEYKQTADMIRQKFQTPDYESDLDAAMTDPLGSTAYSHIVEKQAEEAESEMIRLQIQTAKAERQAQAARLRAEKAAAEAREMEVLAGKSAAGIEISLAQKAAAQAEQDAAVKEAAVQQSRMTQTQAAVEQAQAEAQWARQAAQEAQTALQETHQKVQRLEQEAQKAHQEAHKIQQKLEELEKQEPAQAPSGQDSPPTAPEAAAPAQSETTPQMPVEPVTPQ
jgi:Flp pilus assembly secretin CpaC